MDIALSASAAVIRTAGGVSPQWGAAIALPLFARIAKPVSVLLCWATKEDAEPAA